MHQSHLLTTKKRTKTVTKRITKSNQGVAIYLSEVGVMPKFIKEVTKKVTKKGVTKKVTKRVTTYLS